MDEDLTEEHAYPEQNQKLCDLENLQPPQIKEEQEELHPETSNIKEEQEEIHPELLNIKVIQVELHPEPSYFKEEHDEPCSSPDGQQFVLNHEADRAWIVKPECEGIFLEDEPRHQLDVTWNPETRLHRKDLPHHHVCKEEILSDQQLCNQERNFSLDQEEPHPPHVKEEEGEGCSSWKTGKVLLIKDTETLTIGTTDEEHNHMAYKTKEDLFLTDYISLSLSEGSNQEGNKMLNSESMTNYSLVRRYACSICGKRYKEKRDLLLHVKTHSGDELTRKTCEQKCEDSSTLETLKMPHTGEKLFSCETCGKSFFKKIHLLLHTRTHTGQRLFPGESCSKNFSEKKNLLRNMRTQTGEKQFSCETCSKSFIRKTNLLLHMRTHTGERPFSCETCGKSFIRKYTLLDHMKTHTGERPFSCETCRKSFIQKSKLLYHMKTHTGERPFSCETCGKHYITKSALQDHIKTHSSERPFSCEMCGKSFRRKDDLVCHMRTHTGERPFSCESCEKSFRHRSDLFYHLRIHTGDKPFSCEICGKSFIDSRQLRCHVRTHTGEKPFSCKVCGMGFTKKTYLLKHLRIHKG